MSTQENLPHYSIGEISKLFDIPTSTLRYWEEKELFTIKRNGDNEYREFDIQATIELLDIIFYRNLNVPIKKMKHFNRLSPETIFELLEDTERKVEDDLTKLQEKLIGISGRKQQLKELFALQKRDYQPGLLPLKRIVSLDMNNPDDMQAQLTGPTNFFLVKTQFSDDIYQMGLDVSKGIVASNQTIWENDFNTHKKYFTCLFETNTEYPAINNLPEHTLAMEKLGYKIKTIVAQYLATGCNERNEPVDYYKAWLEVENYSK